jgi:hypothetical protein
MPRRPDGPTTPPRRKAHTPHPPPPPVPARAAGLGGLLRGPGSVLGGLSAVDGASRSLDRLSRAADRGAAFLERMEEEIGWERLRALIGSFEGIVASLEEIEAMVADLHEEYMPAPTPKAKPAPRARP